MVQGSCEDRYCVTSQRILTKAPTSPHRTFRLRQILHLSAWQSHSPAHVREAAVYVEPSSIDDIFAAA